MYFSLPAAAGYTLGRRMAIADIPAVSVEAGEGALLPLAKAASERDLRERGR